MDKDNSINNYNHSISLLERKNLVITGVKKIENFDNNQFILETIMGFMIVKGEGLELVKLDTLSGNVSIKGLVNSINYVEESSKKEKEESIFSRLFKWVWIFKYILWFIPLYLVLFLDVDYSFLEKFYFFINGVFYIPFFMWCFFFFFFFSFYYLLIMELSIYIFYLWLFWE